MNIIQKLNSIDIKDLKSIDVQKVKESLLNRPDVLINLAIGFVTFIVAINIVLSQQSKAKELKNEITVLEEKLTAVNENNLAKKSYDEFIENFPEPIRTDLLIAKISEVAGTHNIRVNSISPSVDKGDDITNHSTVTLAISTSSYKNLVTFMKDIETLPYFIRIEEWKGKTDDRYSRRRTDNNQKVAISATIRIGSLELKDET